MSPKFSQYWNRKHNYYFEPYTRAISVNCRIKRKSVLSEISGHWNSYSRFVTLHSVLCDVRAFDFLHKLLTKCNKTIRNMWELILNLLIILITKFQVSPTLHPCNFSSWRSFLPFVIFMENSVWKIASRNNRVGKSWISKRMPAKPWQSALIQQLAYFFLSIFRKKLRHNLLGLYPPVYIIMRPHCNLCRQYSRRFVVSILGSKLWI